MADDGRVRRALLFMPGDDVKKIGKGAALGVDSIIMDLEDSVALANKQAARDSVVEALTSGEIDFGRTERLVRVNTDTSGFLDDDLKAVMPAHPDGIVLPKVESSAVIRFVARVLLDEESMAGIAPGTIKLLALIETARGVVNLKDIASSDPRLVALMFGAEDLAGSLGAIRTVEGHEVAYGRGAVVIHAAAYDLQSIDTPYVDLKNFDGLRADTERAVQMGYTGKMAIHPAQVEVITSVLDPADEEVAHAQAMIAAHAEHREKRAGVFVFEGKMVDMPMIRAAERVLARAQAAGKLPR